ncbi:ComEC/Rec2 family competence protein [Falsiroseomonas sp. CW058]|uniref:ComEC/Rec2 family competence protein n=1 Tax=Falsiroseomonas sp. CW058 TaxID=3388664 RepID=UPI003D32042D
MSLVLHPAGRPGLLVRAGAGAAGLLAHQHGRFAPWMAVALGAGIVAYFERATEPGPGVLWAVPALGLAALLLARRSVLAAWLCGLAAAAALGFGAAAWHAARMPPPLVLPFGAVSLTGTVAEVEALPEGLRLTLDAPRLGGGEALPRRLRVRLRADDPARPEPGQAVALRALLREPGAPAAPGGWDFQRAAYFSGLGGSGFALGPARVLPGEGAPPALAALRARLEQRIRAGIPGAPGAIAAALVTGSQGAIPAAELAAMRDSGLAHLLSVSGLHMAIVMGAVFAVLRLALAAVPWVALRVPGKAVAAIGGLAAGGFYMLLTGSQVPMQRCFGMAVLVTLAILSGRRPLSLRALALAAAAVMLAAPAELLGPSFQMSFAAVLALVAGHEALAPALARLRTLPGPWRRPALLVAGLVVTSALAGAATAPFGLHHFGRLQLYGIAANAVAVPLTSLWVMPAGMVALVAMPVGLEAWPLWLMGQGVEGILWVARLVAAWPGAAPALAPLPGWSLALAAFGFCWLCLWQGTLRWPGVPMVVAGLAAGLASPPPDLLVSPDSRLVALRTPEGVFLHRLPGATAFTRDALLRRMGVAAAQPLPEEGEVAGGAIACSAAACRFRPRPGAAEAVLLRTPPPPRGARRGPGPDAAALAEACGRAALIVATEPIRPRCAASAAIDRFTTWRDGPQAAWLGPAGAVLVAGRAMRGDRPWVPAPPLPGRAEPLPLAPRDGEAPDQ